MNNLFLGIDCSTQSMSGLLIEEISTGDKVTSRVIYEASINFEAEFPEYGVKNGVLIPQGDDRVQCTPPQLWVEALESLFTKMKEDGAPLSDIKCIGVSGQQHASVYLKGSMKKILAALSPEASLVSQLQAGYSRETSPIWMDSSTDIECREIADNLGGDDVVCKSTGSMCFERFTGPQIRKFFKQNPEAYAETDQICLVSSFIPSILAGKIIPIDPGDGAGMNLMDITSKTWDQKALDATAPGLGDKLAQIISSDEIAGEISPFFTEKFGLDRSCKITPGTGDNPSSLIGLGLVSPGRIGISLGTSDTLFAHMSRPNTDPRGESHVFGSPAGEYMVLSCYKNGSLAREKVKDEFNLSWDEFGSLLGKGEPGNQGKIMLPYFDSEIIPRVNVPGVQKFSMENATTAETVQALIEAQATSMAIHSEWLGETPERIYVTGGGSANKPILQILANVFDADVASQSTTNAAGLGAALRAHQAHRKSRGLSCDWESIVSGHVPEDESEMVKPQSDPVKKLKVFRESYRKVETDYVNGLKVPV